MAQRQGDRPLQRSWAQDITADVNFVRSNVTSSHFLGAPRRAWMAGDHPTVPQPRPAATIPTKLVRAPDTLTTTTTTTTRRGRGRPHKNNTALPHPLVQAQSPSFQPTSSHSVSTRRTDVPLPALQVIELSPEPTTGEDIEETIASVSRPGIPVSPTRRSAADFSALTSTLAPPLPAWSTSNPDIFQQSAESNIPPPQPRNTLNPEVPLRPDRIPNYSYEGSAHRVAAQAPILPNQTTAYAGPNSMLTSNSLHPAASTVNESQFLPVENVQVLAQVNRGPLAITGNAINGFGPQVRPLLSPSTSPAQIFQPLKRPHEPTTSEASRNTRLRLDTTGSNNTTGAAASAQPQTPNATPPPPGTLTQTLRDAAADLRMRGQYGALESQRFSMLNQAVLRNDEIYLVAHLIYCDSSRFPDGTHRADFGPDPVAAVAVLQILLIPNTRLAPAAIDFFATFPFPYARLRDLAFLSSVVKTMFATLAHNWPRVHTNCHRRGYPPCTREICEILGVQSHTLQRVIFTSIHRQIDFSASALWQDAGISLFEQDQSTYEGLLTDKVRSERRGTLLQEIEAFGLAYFQAKANLFRTLSMRPQLAPDAVAQSVRSASTTTQSNGPAHIAPDGFLTFHTPANQLQPVYQGVSNTTSLASRQGRVAPANTQEMQGSTQRQAPVQQPLSHISQPQYSMASDTTAVRRPPVPRPAPQPANAYVPFQVTSNGRPADRPVQGMQSQQTKHAPLLPSKTFVLPITVNPNTSRMALHQSHLRPPVVIKHNASGTEDPQLRLYQYVERVLSGPQAFTSPLPFLALRVHVSAENLQRRAVSLPSDAMFDARQRRIFVPDGLAFRIRCIRVPSGNNHNLNDLWPTAASFWPSHIFISCNDRPLEVQRKAHHGKDLAIDVTDVMQADLNEIRVSVHWSSVEEKERQIYAIGVEAIRVCTQEEVKSQVTTISADDAKSSLITSLSGSSNNDSSTLDDELTIVTDHVSVDLIDPFSSRPFNIPVRSVHCKHRECFDLDSYLLSRTSRPYALDGPSNPDEWQCPICKAKAAPPDLVIDGFLQEIRDELEKHGELDVAKAVIIQKDGSWEAKLENAGEGNVATSAQQDAVETHLQVSTKLPSEAPISAPDTPHQHVEIIEID